MLLLSIMYQLMRCLLCLTVVLVRRDLSKDAELLVLGHENTVLRRQVARVHYTPADRVWLAALSQLVPPRDVCSAPARSWPCWALGHRPRGAVRQAVLSRTLTDAGEVLTHAHRAASVRGERRCVHAYTLAQPVEKRLDRLERAVSR
jgi:hypothetical protein